MEEKSGTLDRFQLKTPEHQNGTLENGCDIILNLIQGAIGLSNTTEIIRNEQELSNNTWTFARLQVHQIIES